MTNVMFQWENSMGALARPNSWPQASSGLWGLTRWEAAGEDGVHWNDDWRGWSPALVGAKSGSVRVRVERGRRQYC